MNSILHNYFERQCWMPGLTPNEVETRRKRLNGEFSFFDSNILEILACDIAEISGKKILEVGAGDFLSTIDLLTYDPKQITVVEINPFGHGLSSDEGEQVLNLMNRENLDLSNVDIHAGYICENWFGNIPISTKDFDYGFFFFPHHDSFNQGHNETLGLPTILSVFDQMLSETGVFYIITELKDIEKYGALENCKIHYHNGGEIKLHTI